MKVRELMVGEVIQIALENSMAEAAKRMREEAVGCLVVTVAGAIKGILTQQDLLDCIGTDHDPSRCKVALHMSRPVFVLRPEEDLVSAADVMLRRHIKRLPVAEGGKLLGIVSLSDLAKFGAAELNTATRFVSSLISAQGADARPAKLQPPTQSAPVVPAANWVPELMARKRAIS